MDELLNIDTKILETRSNIFRSFIKTSVKKSNVGWGNNLIILLNFYISKLIENIQCHNKLKLMCVCVYNRNTPPIISLRARDKIEIICRKVKKYVTLGC